jgi:uncharacterized protein involved in exopolysaccharide biosynthesis
MSYFLVLWRRRNLIIGVMLLFSLGGAALTSFQLPSYQATAFFFPQQQNLNFFRDIQSLNQTEILRDVIDDLNLAALPEYNLNLTQESSVLSNWLQTIQMEIAKFWEADNQDEDYKLVKRIESKTNVEIDNVLGAVIIEVESQNAERSAKIANALQNYYQAKLANNYLFRDVDDIQKGKMAVLMKTAKPNYKPLSPQYEFFALLAGIFGFFMAASICFYCDKRFYKKTQLSTD